MTRGRLYTKRVLSPLPCISGVVSPLEPTDTELVSYYRLCFQPEGRAISVGGGGGRKRKGREPGEVMGAVATRERGDSGVPQTQGGGPSERARDPP